MPTNIRSNVIGMSNTKLQMPKWKKCSEFFYEPCDGVLPECCKSLPCKVCIEFEVYNEIIARGVLEWNVDTLRYEGTLSNYAVVGQWNNDPQCKFDIFFDDVLELELYQCVDPYAVGLVCGEPEPGQDFLNSNFDCRKMESESDLTLGFDEGIFRTYALVPFEVNREIPYGEVCETTQLCNGCNCSPKLICATLVTCDCYRVQLLNFDGTVCARKNSVDILSWSADFICLDPYNPTSVTFDITADEYTGDCLFTAYVDGVNRGANLSNNNCEIINEKYEWIGPAGTTEYLLIKAVGSCNEGCASNQCWEDERRCVNFGTKSNCCDERPQIWNTSFGYFDPDCNIDRTLVGDCIDPPDGIELIGDDDCAYHPDVCIHVDTALNEWTLYIDQIDKDLTYLEHNYSGLRFVVIKEFFQWEDLCTNILFREDMCNPYVDRCTGECPVDYICLTPGNFCPCLTGDPRPVDLPRNIEFTFINPNCCGNKTDAVIWNPGNKRWELLGFTAPGGIDCNPADTMDIYLTCEGGIGGDYSVEFANPVGNTFLEIIGTANNVTPSACYPFMLTTPMGTLSAPCGPTPDGAVSITFLEVL